ncbi:IcmE/DotG protein [Durusdinium trenchii]|uniref:IcmE/DotG protein n=1 Tax=Durusdinium trenchii TaxID=1381693 RepID=A0ABP0L3V8_9DINO
MNDTRAVGSSLEASEHVKTFIHYCNAGASGVLFAVSIFLLMPEAEVADRAGLAVAWGSCVIAGWLLGIMMHQASHMLQPAQVAADNTLEEGQEKEPVAKKANWSLAIPVLLGDFIHNFADGIFLGFAFYACDASFAWSMVGATIAHELPQELLGGDVAPPVFSGLRSREAFGAQNSLSPVVMAFTCEAMRLSFRFAKEMCMSTPKISYRSLEENEEQAEDLESPMIATKTDHPFKGSSSCFTVALIFYHLICAGIVALAIWRGWLSSEGGGLAWELWALWQHLCLWMLFMQNLVRCATLDSDALAASTCTSVLMFTAPLVSELADTMKDWVVTGICILHAKTWIGFAVGAAMVGLDELRIKCLHRKREVISLSFLLLFALYSALLALRVHLWVLIPGAVVWASIVAKDTSWQISGCICCSLPICIVIITDHLSQIDSHAVSFSEEAFLWLADGGLLAVVSAHVLVYSYIQVNSDEDCARDLRKTYRAILELPLRPINPKSETLCQWLGRRLSNICVDFLSRARLLIAWAEDIPQGVIGVVLVLRYAGSKGIGFAGISAIISISKGLLIPGSQRFILSHRSAAVMTGLEGLIEPDAMEGLFARLLKEASPLNADRVDTVVREILSAQSSDLLKQLNVGESEMFRPIQQLRENWLVDACEVVRGRLVAQYLKQGISAKRLFDLGHMAGNCKVAGFSAKQCKEIASFSVEKCRAAGFFPNDCLQAGFSPSDCKDAGFSIHECKEAGFSAKQCKEAGFSAKQCREADFSAEEFRNAGFSAVQCKLVGFEAGACQKAGYTTQEWSRDATAHDYRDAGFSAAECRDARFSAKECKQAGFSLKEILAANFSPEQARDAGFSAGQFKDAGVLQTCRDAHFSAKQCKEAGFSLQDLQSAGFSAVEAFSAGFSASEFKNAGAPPNLMREHGFSAKQCKEAGYSAQECKEAEYSVGDLKDAGFSAVQCKIAGFEAKACQEAGFLMEEWNRDPSAKDYKEAGLSAQQCQIAGFSAKECKEGGFSLQDLVGFSDEDVAKAGFSAHEFKDAGAPAKWLRDHGFSAKQCKEAGYSAQECKNAEYPVKDLKDAGFSAIQCKIAGFESTACQEAGFPKQEWNRDPTAQDYKEANFSAEACRTAGFSAKECKEAGFSFKEVRGAGFSPEETQEAGFPAKDFKEDGAPASWMKNHGFSAKECRYAGYSAEDCRDAGFSAKECREAGF